MFIGVDIGGTKCACVLGDEQGKTVRKIRFPTGNFDKTLENLFAGIADLWTEGDILSIGISCGGPLDEERGIILSPPNLPGWKNVPLKDMLEEKFSVPCGVRNDANASAIAEWRYGAGKGTRNMVFLTFGTGMGAGLILDGKLYSGANGYAGEVGHMRLAPIGPSGYGKCGSFEGFCSGSGLEELGRMMARETIQRGMPCAFCPDGDVGNITAAEMARAARAGDTAARAAFELCGKMLGSGIAMLIDVLNPERIVIGSVYARCQDLLEAPMQAMIEKEALTPARAACRICASALGESIGDAAALAVAAEVYDALHR